MLYVTQTHRIGEFNHKHAGERCFVVGNGPSLNVMDLRCLENEFVIGTNYAFLKEGITTRYICISDTHRMFELAHYFDKIHDKIIFYNSHVDEKTKLSSVPPELVDNTVVWQAVKQGVGINWDIRDNLYCNMEMTSVVFPSIQIAVHMGASHIYLIGVDQDYSGSLWFHGKKGVPHRDIGKCGTIDTIGHNFDYSYETQFKPGIQLMHLELRKRGIGLYNAGVGGKLDAIPRVSFDKLFEVLG